MGGLTVLEGSWDARSVSSLELDSGYGEEAGGPQGKGTAGGQRCSTEGRGRLVVAPPGSWQPPVSGQPSRPAGPSGIT